MLGRPSRNNWLAAAVVEQGHWGLAPIAMSARRIQGQRKRVGGAETALYAGACLQLEPLKLLLAPPVEAASPSWWP